MEEEEGLIIPASWTRATEAIVKAARKSCSRKGTGEGVVVAALGAKGAGEIHFLEKAGQDFERGAHRETEW